MDKAERVFSKLVTHSPLRLDDLDTYSNILYVMDRKAKLSFLAQLTTATDPFRPETCVVVGNYYAMKSEHEKAVLHFRRALALDRNFLSAWTLMGHEYIELKNTHAAVECYRRAVDVNRKDYRAWYGLGQTYEVLEMYLYALFYFERAAALCPSDPKMWSAMGQCLQKMQRPQSALKSYKRALVAGRQYEEPGAGFGGGGAHDQSLPGAILDPETLFSIATVYDMLNDVEQTRASLEMVLAQEEGGGDDDETDAALRDSVGTAPGAVRAPSQGVGITATTSKARLWLVKLEMAAGGEAALRRALELANELCQDGFEVEEAKSLIREIKARIEVEVETDEEMKS